MPSKFVPTPKDQCPHALCLELDAEMTAEQVNDFVAWIQREAAKTRGATVTQLWCHRFDPQVDHPVFYCP